MITQPLVCLIIVISNKNYKLIVIDLAKQQAFDGAQKAEQKINFTGNFDQAEGAWTFINLKEVRETILNFCKEL